MAQTLQDYVAASFVKMDDQIKEMITKGEDTEALLGVSMGNLQVILSALAKRLDEMTP